MEQKKEMSKFIDLEQIIKNKNPRLLKIIPGFLIRYLKRTIHQDEVNDAIFSYKDLYGLDFVRAMLEERFKVNITYQGLENISLDKRFIVASNHPLGGMDGMALMHVIGQKKKDIVFPVNDLLMHLDNLKPLFIPINKHGSNAQNIAIYQQTFESDLGILYFPAGLCSRKIKGKIVDLEWKKTFITYAKRYKRDIIPAYTEGRNSNFFYNLANFRKRFRIKANIEMLYLVDEMFKQARKSVHITIGKPIPFNTFDKRFTDQQWAEKVKQYVYQLKNNPSLEFTI